MKKLFKKSIFILSISAIIGSMLTTPITAIEESIEERKSGVELFYEYLETLDEFMVQATLADEELVEIMQKDEYWYPEDMGLVRSARAVTLPLSSYPAGKSYYSVNGSACNTCHSYGCTYEVPSGFTDYTTCYYYNNGWKKGNCKRYAPKGSIQCAGFADYVYNQHTGHDTNIVSQFGALSLFNQDQKGKDRVAEYFGYLTIGSNVRGHLRGKVNGYNHSFIIVLKTNTGVTMYDANFNGDCKVQMYTKTWTEIVGLYDYFLNSWHGAI